MRRNRIAVAAVAACLVVLALLWAGAGDEDRSTTRPDAGAPGTSTYSRPGNGSGGGATPGTGATPGAGGAVPGTAGRSGSPGVASDPAAAGFLTELGAIDPGLVADPTRALNSGRDTCQDIQASKPYEAVVRDAVRRFSTDSVAVNGVKATLIVDAARNHLCPG